MKKILLIIMSFFVLNLNVLAEEDFAPNGKSAILVDNLSGKVLYEKNADEKLAPASMTKLASMLMVMEAIDNGNLKFEDKVTISEEAANMGGSQVFLQAGEVYTVYDLLKSDVNMGTKYRLVSDFDEVLSLDLLKSETKKIQNEDEILAKINERTEAKKNKDYEKADEIREELLNMGIVIKDTREGTTYEAI